MKLLFDENLSRHLVARLATHFPDSAHVTNVNLERATDREVWEFAGRHDYVIVSKDSDFNDLAFMHGRPPKVIWLRVGNASTDAIATLLADAAETVTTFASNDEDAVLTLNTSPRPIR